MSETYLHKSSHFPASWKEEVLNETVDLNASRERVRHIAEGMTALAERDDLLQRVLEAGAERDPRMLRAALRELPGDPLGFDQCFHYVLVSVPVKMPVLGRVCRWVCGIHSGESVPSDGRVELPSGRPATLSPETLAALEDIGVIQCGIGLVGIDRQLIEIWQQVCDPDYADR